MQKVNKIKIRVIGGDNALQKAKSKIELLGIANEVELILIDPSNYKDKGFEVDKIFIEECIEIPKELTLFNPKGCTFINELKNRYTHFIDSNITQ